MAEPPMPNTARPVGRAGGAAGPAPANTPARRLARHGVPGRELARQAGDGAEHVAGVELGDELRAEPGGDRRPGRRRRARVAGHVSPPG